MADGALGHDPHDIIIAALGGGERGRLLAARVLTLLDQRGWRFAHADDRRALVRYRAKELPADETLDGEAP